MSPHPHPHEETDDLYQIKLLLIFYLLYQTWFLETALFNLLHLLFWYSHTFSEFIFETIPTCLKICLPVISFDDQTIRLIGTIEMNSRLCWICESGNGLSNRSWWRDWNILCFHCSHCQQLPHPHHNPQLHYFHYLDSFHYLVTLFIFLRVGEGYWLCFLNMKFIAHAQFPGPQHYFA